MHHYSSLCTAQQWVCESCLASRCVCLCVCVCEDNTHTLAWCCVSASVLVNLNCGTGQSHKSPSSTSWSCRSFYPEPISVNLLLYPIIIIIMNITWIYKVHFKRPKDAAVCLCTFILMHSGNHSVLAFLFKILWGELESQSTHVFPVKTQSVHEIFVFPNLCFTVTWSVHLEGCWKGVMNMV